jgi:hypothetical protein
VTIRERQGDVGGVAALRAHAFCLFRAARCQDVSGSPRCCRGHRLARIRPPPRAPLPGDTAPALEHFGCDGGDHGGRPGRHAPALAAPSDRPRRPGTAAPRAAAARARASKHCPGRGAP